MNWLSKFFHNHEWEIVGEKQIPEIPGPQSKNAWTAIAEVYLICQCGERDKKYRIRRPLTWVRDGYSEAEPKYGTFLSWSEHPEHYAD